MTVASLGRHRALAGLVAASGISMMGTAMSVVAVPWLVLSSTGSAGRTGLVAFAAAAPYVVALALAGPVIDRVGIRRSCMAGNIAAAAVTAVIPAGYAAGTIGYGALVVVVAAAGLARGVADGAITPLVPGAAALGGTSLERAAGLAAGATQSGTLLGAPIAGVLVATIGAASTVAVDAASFAVAAVLVAGLVPAGAAPQNPPEKRMTPRRYAHDLAGGMRFLAGDRLLISLIAMIVVTNLLEQGMFTVLLPVWVRSELGDPRALGYISGAFAAAELGGNLVTAWAGRRLPRRATYAVGFLLAGAPRFLALAFLGTLAPVIAVTAATAFAYGVLNPIVGAVQYERIPDHLRARVLGAVRASAWLGIPFGPLLAGSATSTLGLHTTLLIAAGIYLTATLVPFVFPVWRGLNRAPQPPTQGEPATA